jgi:hypothetical protein
MTKTDTEVIKEIIAALPAASDPALVAGVASVYQLCPPEVVERIRVSLIGIACHSIAAVQTANPQLDRAHIDRALANEVLHVAAFVLRAVRQREGTDLVPGRFALLAFDIADHLCQQPWVTLDEPEQPDK